ncbi:terminase small subunit [Halomonas mongoliensis]|uniref:terminase small subunit n=1 Tax=Halomonas mongoliensis TaxID=321265 RepID=UPI00403B1AB0
MASSKPTAEPHWLNRKQMAASLGISVTAFDKWGIEPVARIGREVFFDVRSVLDAKLSEAEAKQQQHQPGEIDGEVIDPLMSYRKDQEDLRLTRARAESQELKNDRDARRVVPVEFAIYALSGTASQIATIFDTLPLTIRRKHPELAQRYLQSFDREVTKARNVAAELPEKLPTLLDGYWQHLEGNE